MKKEYFKINGWDYSYGVSGLKVSTKHTYNAQTNAAGDTVVDLINTKRVVTVTFNPKCSNSVLEYLNQFNVTITYLDPETLQLVSINCIAATYDTDYYTLSGNRVPNFQPFTVTFTEL